MVVFSLGDEADVNRYLVSSRVHPCVYPVRHQEPMKNLILDPSNAIHPQEA